MKLKDLKRVQETIIWPTPEEKLPVVTWQTCTLLRSISALVEPNISLVQEESKTCILIVIAGFLHDVSSFLKEHPGGSALLRGNSGKDMTTAFFGGVYNHSNAAHNVSQIIACTIINQSLMNDSCSR